MYQRIPRSCALERRDVRAEASAMPRDVLVLVGVRVRVRERVRVGGWRTMGGDTWDDMHKMKDFA